MAPADRLTGSATVVRYTPEGGSATIISGDQTSFSWDRQLDTVDVTAGNETERYFAPTIEGLEWTLMIFDADQSYLADVLPRSQGLLEVMKEGIGSGLPIVSFNTLINSNTEDFPYDGALEIEISGVRQGAMINEVGSVQA